MATGPMKGMDYDEVSRWASSVRSSELAQLDSLMSALCSAAESLPWSGADFEKFVGTEVANVKQQAGQLKGAIEQMASTASTNAANQQTTSAT